MIERGDDARFALEALAEVRIGSQGRGEDLDGDDAIEAGVARLVDLAHAAGAKGGLDFVRAKACARLQGHRGSAGIIAGKPAISQTNSPGCRSRRHVRRGGNPGRTICHSHGKFRCRTRARCERRRDKRVSACRVVGLRFTKLPTSVTHLESSGDRLSFLQTRAKCRTAHLDGRAPKSRPAAGAAGRDPIAQIVSGPGPIASPGPLRVRPS